MLASVERAQEGYTLTLESKEPVVCKTPEEVSTHLTNHLHEEDWVIWTSPALKKRWGRK